MNFHIQSRLIQFKVVSNNAKIYFWLSLLAKTLFITQKLDNLETKFWIWNKFSRKKNILWWPFGWNCHYFLYLLFAYLSKYFLIDPKVCFVLKNCQHVISSSGKQNIGNFIKLAVPALITKISKALWQIWKRQNIWLLYLSHFKILNTSLLPIKTHISDRFWVIGTKSWKIYIIFSFLVRKMENGVTSDLQSPGGAVCNSSGIFYVL